MIPSGLIVGFNSSNSGDNSRGILRDEKVPA